MPKIFQKRLKSVIVINFELKIKKNNYFKLSQLKYLKAIFSNNNLN